MFHPVDHPMERGWVGRIDGDEVVHLAAQTLQSFFTGGGSAREHAVYALADVSLIAPVLHPPSIRVFDEQEVFAFANPAAIVGPGAEIHASGDGLTLVPRLAGVIGVDGALAGYSAFAEWRDPALSVPKDRDFALALGPVVVTADAFLPDGAEAVVRAGGSERLRGRFDGFEWARAVALAADRTTLKPGDLVAGPSLGAVDGLPPGAPVELDVAGIGILAQREAT